MPTRPFLPAAMLVMLSACGMLGKGPVQGFELRSGASVTAARNLNIDLIVEEPETAGSLATDRVLMRPSGIEAAYLPAAQWTEAAPLMVQTLLVRTMQQTGGYAYVGRKPLGLSGDYAVLSELTDLQGELVQDGDGTAIQARVALRVSVVRERDARVMGTRLFAAQSPATGDSASEITVALDSAMHSLLPELTAWILTTTGPGTR